VDSGARSTLDSEFAGIFLHTCGGWGGETVFCWLRACADELAVRMAIGAWRIFPGIFALPAPAGRPAPTLVIEDGNFGKSLLSTL
jgi:hypothetical protein